MSSGKPYFGLRGGWLVFWISVACSADMTLFGYDQGVIGGVAVTENFLQVHNLAGDEHTKVLGTVIAIYDIGCFFGAVFVIWQGQNFGRKMSILLGTLLMSIGAILQISSYSVAQMIVGRIIAGVGNGINTATAPIWQAETASLEWRGTLGLLQLCLNVSGFSLSNWITFGFSYIDGPLAWRFPLAFQFIFIFIIFGTVPWLPESPRWLVARGRSDEAIQILADLEALPTSDPYVLAQHKEIAVMVDYERNNALPWSQILMGRGGAKDTKTLRRLILGAGPQMMQQMSGINVTSYYLPTLLIKSVHLSEKMARLLAAVNSVSYLLFGCVCVPFIDRLGRRKMMMASFSGMFVCYLIITILIRYSEQESNSATTVGSASVAFFFLYYWFFAILQGIPWLYCTEINSLAMRTKGVGFGVATNWMFNFIVVEIVPIGLQNLRWKFYLIWLICNLVFVPVIYLFYPETAGRTLEDLDRYFQNNPSLFVFSDPQAIGVKRPQKFIEEELEAVRSVETSNGRPD